MNRREMTKIMTLAAGAAFASSTKTFAIEAPWAALQMQEHSDKSGGVGVQDLLREPLAKMENPEVTLLILHLAPGENSHPHRHTGPVFAYILEGTILNQVEPEPAKKYNPGDFFYEPPMHVHKQMKNLSDTKPAKVLVFQVGEKGKEFTVSA